MDVHAAAEAEKKRDARLFPAFILAVFVLVRVRAGPAAFFPASSSPFWSSSFSKAHVRDGYSTFSITSTSPPSQIALALGVGLGVGLQNRYNSVSVTTTIPVTRMTIVQAFTNYSWSPTLDLYTVSANAYSLPSGVDAASWPKFIGPSASPDGKIFGVVRRLTKSGDMPVLPGETEYR